MKRTDSPPPATILEPRSATVLPKGCRSSKAVMEAGTARTGPVVHGVRAGAGPGRAPGGAGTGVARRGGCASDAKSTR